MAQLILVVTTVLLAQLVLGQFPVYDADSSPYSAAGAVQQTSLQMPGVIPFKNDTYLCTSFALNTDYTNYLVGFDPIADLHGVHHVLLFGCEAPGSEEQVWNCGEMTHSHSEAEDASERRAPVCTSQPNILYAWAHNAPKLDLPNGVGFRVAGNTNNNYLVLQVHYMHAMDKPDYSGIQVASTLMPQPRTAATLLVVTGGEIPAKSKESLEAACVIDEPVEMHPFAYRVHTHRHGTNVGGWIVRENPTTRKDQWTKLGERDPQKPQLFETVANQSIVVSQGDILAARCDFNNPENRKIEVGPTGEDEMCNFYMMYWVDGEEVLDNNICFSPGAPHYHWAKEAGLNNIPKH